MMSEAFKGRLFPRLQQIVKHFGTPFHIYDEKGIRETACRLKSTFRRFGFQEFFAVKALPTPAILKIMEEVGFGFDCSSEAELVLSRNTGATGDRIMFTSNNTTTSEFRMALDPKAGGCILNLDDMTLIGKVPGHFPGTVCFRYNPGSRRTGNVIIGNPVEAKYGVSHSQIVRAYEIAKRKGAKRFGLHTMICSNELNYQYMVETVKSLLELVEMVSAKLGITFDFINMGGGLGIPYKPEHKPIDIVTMAKEIGVLFDTFRKRQGYTPRLFMESGRYVTGPHGVLVTKVINQKHTYREYRGVDACMSSLMRPGMYGAYHHIHVVDKHGEEKTRLPEVVDVVGGLCENNDKFAVQRSLPKMTEGDHVVINDTGAHGIAMCFQYNGRPRPKELMLCIDGTVKLVARGETIEDLLARHQFKENVLKCNVS